MNVSKSLKEVWDWKDALYEETKDMSKEELVEFFNGNTKEFLATMGYKKNPVKEGIYKLEKINVVTTAR